MDYIELKRTLVAAFDHFLSYHDMDELEEMMQALEAGKWLVIGFPEPIHREDYKDDALAREGQKDDTVLMASPVKKRVSRVRRKKPKPRTAAPQEMQKHLCDIPVFMDMSVLSSEKQKQLCKLLETGQHNITLKDIMIKGQHILAMARVSMSVQSRRGVDDDPLWMGLSEEPVQSEKVDRVKERKAMHFHEKKKCDPP